MAVGNAVQSGTQQEEKCVLHFCYFAYFTGLAVMFPPITTVTKLITFESE
jgi:hypothetical protein